VVKVLSGAERTLKIKKYNPVLYLENNCKKVSRELIEFVSSLGYTCHWHVNPYFSETNFKGNEVDIFPENANSINMLCYSMNDPASVQKVRKLSSLTRIDVARGMMLHEYNLIYTGKETVLSQPGTIESCEREGEGLGFRVYHTI